MNSKVTTSGAERVRDIAIDIVVHSIAIELCKDLGFHGIQVWCISVDERDLKISIKAQDGSPLDRSKGREDS